LLTSFSPTFAWPMTIWLGNVGMRP
jgi:hypothetical protein